MLMRVNRCHKILPYFFLLSWFITQAQDRNDFTMDFVKRDVSQNNAGIIDASVKIINTSDSELRGTFETHSSHEDLYLVQRKPKQLSIAVKDSVFLPVKIIVASTAQAGNQAVIEAVFSLPDGNQKTLDLPITINERKLVKMFASEINLVYENIGDSLTIPLHILNEGNTEQKINLVARYPDFISPGVMETETINVKPFADTIVHLQKLVTKNILNQEDFNIVVTALYDNGDIIGIANIKASSIKQNRRYSAQFTPDYLQSFRQTNQITASTQRNSNDINSYYIYANAEAEINGSKVLANVDANWWDNSEEIFLRNTWLAYKAKNWGALAGSLSKFGDINLVGRGIEAYYTTKNNSKFEAGALDKSFNLFDYSNISSGNAGWAGYYHKGGLDQNGHEASVIYDNDNFYNIQSYLATSRFTILKKQGLNLKTGGSISHAASGAEGTDKTGAAAEVNASGKIKNIFYSSSNFLSTAYFAGVKRGVISLNERVNISLGQYNLWLLYNYLSVEPKQLIAQNYFANQFSTERYSIGASRRYGKFVLSASPNIYNETRKENIFGEGVQDLSMNAARLSIGTTYSHGNTIVSFLAEGGSFKSDAYVGENNFHFKGSLNYSWRIFGLMATYQYNNFNLGEIVANSQMNTNGETFYNITVMPSLQFNLLKNKLSCYSGFMYSSNSIIDRTIQFTGRAEYKISSDFTAFANGYYSDISNSPYALNSVMIGITKQFQPVKIDRTRSSLDVYVYYENTGKGPLDALNTPAADQLVIINGKAFRTNSQGMIKYRSLPPGDYDIRLINSEEWHAHNRTVSVTQDTEIAIGLTKTSTIKGTISYTATDKSYDITKKMSGLSIIAVDDNGNVFHTRTDDNGNFVLYIPEGTYTITLEKAGVSEYVEIEGNNQVIKAVPETTTQINFILNIKEKRIETRKFTSRGFPSIDTEEKKKKKK